MEARGARKVSARALVVLVVVALVVLAVDQLAKWWVVGNLPYREPQRVVGDLLIFEYDRNPGAAFSIGTGSTWIFSIIAVAVLVFVIWYARRIRSTVWALVLGLVLGGLLGNLADRLFRPPGFGVGEVVDFLRIPLLPAIFNLADTAIVSAMVLFLVLTVMGVGLDGRRVKAVPAGGRDAAGDAVPAADAEPADRPSSEKAADTAPASGASAEPVDAPCGGADDAGSRAESRVAGLGEARHPVDGRA